MVNPNKPNNVTEQAPTEETVDRVVELLKHIDWKTLIDGVDKDEASNDVEDIYPIENPVGTTDDMAIVVYKGVEKPHKHTGDETEAHIGAEGEASYFINDNWIVMAKGLATIIPPETPHFAFANPRDQFVAVVVSSPSFNPENEIPLSADNPSDVATLEMYNELIAS